MASGSRSALPHCPSCAMDGPATAAGWVRGPLPRSERSARWLCRSLAPLALPLLLAALISGCAVVTVGAAVVATAATVASTAVDVGVGAVKVTGKVIGKGVDVVTGSPPPPAPAKP